MPQVLIDELSDRRMAKIRKFLTQCIDKPATVFVRKEIVSNRECLCFMKYDIKRHMNQEMFIPLSKKETHDFK